MLRGNPTYFIEALEMPNSKKLIAGNNPCYISPQNIDMLEESLKVTANYDYVETVAIFKIYPTTTPLADRLKQYPSC